MLLKYYLYKAHEFVQQRRQEHSGQRKQEEFLGRCMHLSMFPDAVDFCSKILSNVQFISDKLMVASQLILFYIVF